MLFKVNKKSLQDLEGFLRKKGYSFIAGVDEAGRGALAGPVCAAAVILKENFPFEKLKDSKLLTPEKREELFSLIIKEALSYSIVMIDSNEINQIGIFKATFKAMKQAVESLRVSPEIVLVDGPFIIPDFSGVQKAVVKGDSLCPSISAASILAKVARDRFMKELEKRYPHYSFSRHKGYATKLHREEIKKFGLSPIHRSYYPSVRLLVKNLEE